MTSSREPGAREVQIVGSGPVAALLAVLLARRGHACTLHERREDPRRVAIPAGRSINLALSARGIHALERAGVAKQALAQAVPMRGRLIHARDGNTAYQPYGPNDSFFINSISRAELTRALITAAERAGGSAGGVEIRFHSRAVKYDPAAATLEIETARPPGDPSRRTLPAPVVFGADGAGSVVREALVASGSVRDEYADLGYQYKELTLPAGAGGAFRMEKHALHIWPRGAFMLIALPNFDGSFTCTLFLPTQAAQESAAGFDRLTDARAVRAFFEREFPDAARIIPAFDEQFLSNPTGHLGTVRARPWHFEGARAKALLIGDAAHAVVPFFGQGLNAGFEDCVVLDEVLAREGDFARAFAEFSRDRIPDADAIAAMALENFVEMRDRVADPAFLLRKGIERELETRLPGHYVSRYGLVTFSRVPYRVALEAGRAQDEILAELAAGLAHPADVDLARARARIADKLDPILEPWRKKGLLDGFRN